MPDSAKKPALSPEEEAQKEDEKILSENKQEIEEVLKFIETMKDLEKSNHSLKDLRSRIEGSTRGKLVFH